MRPRNAACDFLPTLEMTLGPKERIARRLTKINRLLFFFTCLSSLLAPLPPSLAFQNTFPFISSPTISPHPRRPLQCMASPGGSRGAKPQGAVCFLGESSRALAAAFQLMGLGASKPLWGSAPHSWDGISLQPWIKHKISGRTNRIAQQAVGRGRNQS